MKKGATILAIIAGILMPVGVLFAGFTGAPQVLTKWSGQSYYYGSGHPLFTVGFWVSLIISAALLFIPLAKTRLKEDNPPIVEYIHIYQCTKMVMFVNSCVKLLDTICLLNKTILENKFEHPSVC